MHRRACRLREVPAFKTVVDAYGYREKVLYLDPPEVVPVPEISHVSEKLRYIGVCNYLVYPLPDPVSRFAQHGVDIDTLGDERDPDCMEHQPVKIRKDHPCSGMLMHAFIYVILPPDRQKGPPGAVTDIEDLSPRICEVWFLANYAFL